MMRIQIISKDNGLGLSNDVQILRNALVGIAGNRMAVDFTDWQSPRKVAARSYDVNIFLELINPLMFPQAHKNVFVPNPEWFMASWRPYLRQLDQVWAKTRDCERLFGRIHKGTVFTGWTSIDRYIPNVIKETQIIHVAGGSSAKGTHEVMRAMELLPDLSLTVVTSRTWADVPPNVTILPRQGAAELSVLMNSHRIHLCPSSYEGFGHYINEARSCAAVIVTTNAAPMNELVTSSYGLGAAVATTSNQNLAQHKHVSVPSLADCISTISQTPEHLLEHFGARAREAYLKGATEFDLALIKYLPA